MILVKDVVKHFGGLAAVDGVSMEIESGTITGLIGPNGAGKTTLFNLIAGKLTPGSGSIFLNGEDVTGLKPHELFSKGLLRTFQVAHEFPTLSVLDNLMMVPSMQIGESLLGAWFKREKVVRQEAENRGKAEEVISFLNMGHMANELAGTLSGGQKKLLELGRTHDMDFINRLCDPVVVMAEGKILAQGSVDEIKANEDVIEAYLGTGLKNKGEVLPG